MARFAVPDRHKPALRQLLTLTSAEVEDIRAQIELLDGRYQAVQEVLGQHVDQAPDVLEALITLAVSIKRLELSDGDLRDALDKAFPQGDDQEPASRVYPLVAASVIQVLGKALDLRNSYERILLASRIFSDIRPVFGDDEVGGIVEAAMVNHTLQVTYQTGARIAEVHIALDKADLKKLSAQIERALTKESAAKAMIEKSGATVLEPLERQE